MSAFIESMDKLSYMEQGVNGSDVYSVPVGKQQELLALFGALNRDLETETLYNLMTQVGNSYNEDMMVMAFHVRDILEGKGERLLFYRMFYYLVKKGVSVNSLLKLIPNYGGWFDLQKLIEYGMKEKHILPIAVESRYN